jgi:hypothetical protein
MEVSLGKGITFESAFDVGTAVELREDYDF